ncbi:hypothetical protein AB4298_12720 [Shewanella sp. 10N.261.52.F9]|uniref:hypothetical protein n=1 Tax=Shewanella sp. 10N.261.52.F9 TaxID=3229684 RepID=UPI0035506788
MRKDIDREMVKGAIALLKSTDEYNVSKLAKTMEVSRPFLYKHFDDLLERTEISPNEEKIKTAIKVLRARTGTKNQSKSAVAAEAGISRQSIIRYYKHLEPYIYGTKDFDEEDDLSEQISLEIQNRKLKKEINALEAKHQEELSQEKDSILTTLMLQDLKTFSAQEADLSLNKLQTQNDELKSQSRQQLNELAKLKADLNDMKQQLSGGVATEIKGHFKANYDAITSELTDKQLLKLFLAEEQQNLQDAIEACITSQPDAILFFQPFLSCSIKEARININAKRVVIIESNLFLSKYYKELIDSLPNTPIHAISAQNIKLTKALFFCRATYGTDKFNDDFLTKLLEKICPPSLQDGFASTSVFATENTLSVVRRA